MIWRKRRRTWFIYIYIYLKRKELKERKNWKEWGKEGRGYFWRFYMFGRPSLLNIPNFYCRTKKLLLPRRRRRKTRERESVCVCVCVWGPLARTYLTKKNKTDKNFKVKENYYYCWMMKVERQRRCHIVVAITPCIVRSKPVNHKEYFERPAGCLLGPSCKMVARSIYKSNGSIYISVQKKQVFKFQINHPIKDISLWLVPYSGLYHWVELT